MVPASAVGNATPMLHAQQQQQQQLPMQQQPVAMAWQLPMMGNGGSVLAPMMGGGMGLVPMAQMPQGMMLVGKATAHAGEHKNGGSLNGRNGGSSQRQATNREAQKRYRCGEQWGRGCRRAGQEGLEGRCGTMHSKRRSHHCPTLQSHRTTPSALLQGAPEDAPAGDAGHHRPAAAGAGAATGRAVGQPAAGGAFGRVGP